MITISRVPGRFIAAAALRRVALATAVSVLAGVAFAPLAQASPYDRWCSTGQDGWVVGPRLLGGTIIGVFTISDNPYD